MDGKQRNPVEVPNGCILQAQTVVCFSIHEVALRPGRFPSEPIKLLQHDQQPHTVRKLDLLESARTSIRRPELAIMGYRDAEGPGCIPVFIDHRRWLDEPTVVYGPRMVKELDLFESNNGCGMNGLANGPCRRTRQHRWG